MPGFGHSLFDSAACRRTFTAMSKLHELPPSAAHHCLHCGEQPPTNPPVPTLIPLEAARKDRLGGISRSTLYALISEGELRRVNIGRRAFITGESIDNYLKGLV